MTLESARRQVFTQLVSAGFKEEEAAAAVAALVIAGSLSDQVPAWIPASFAARASYPARDIAAEAIRIRAAYRCGSAPQAAPRSAPQAAPRRPSDTAQAQEPRPSSAPRLGSRSGLLGCSRLG